MRCCSSHRGPTSRRRPLQRHSRLRGWYCPCPPTKWRPTSRPTAGPWCCWCRGRRAMATRTRTRAARLSCGASLTVPSKVRCRPRKGMAHLRRGSMAGAIWTRPRQGLCTRLKSSHRLQRHSGMRTTRRTRASQALTGRMAMAGGPSMSTSSLGASSRLSTQRPTSTSQISPPSRLSRSRGCPTARLTDSPVGFPMAAGLCVWAGTSNPSSWAASTA
mmetsp:Transcript_12837/g.37251  ORF Transcript_12837/g.37251 Transcript_12837/m.37251 type:complete len:217 (-) Transcript_12837:1866-2516(-)